MKDNVNVLVLGLGISGCATLKILNELKVNVYVYDDCKKDSKYPYCNNLDIINLCIVSPGIHMNHPILKELRARKIHIMSELEFGSNYINNDIIAITGTNGKTTTTLLVTKLLNRCHKKAISMGNIGNPVTHYYNKLDINDIAVVEVSSFQLETTNNFCPKVAAIINIAPDHLDRHLDYRDYVDIKLSMFNNLNPQCRAVINYDNEILRLFSQTLSIPVTYFSAKYKINGCYVLNNNIYYDGFVCSIEDISMQGKHNIENALCALSICLPMGVPKDIARDVLMTFNPPIYRMTDRGIKSGKKYINDSKGTNIHSTLSACNSVSGDTVLIMGGSDKGEDYKEIFENIPQNIKYILVTGENAPHIMSAADECNYKMIIEMNSLKDCIQYAEKLDVKVVLFSPASASYDNYCNYMERGREFDNLI